MKTRFSMKWRKMGAFALAMAMSLTAAYAQTITLTGASGATVTNNSDSTTIAYTDKYKTATYNVSESGVSEVTISATADAQFCIKLCDASGTAFATDYPGYGLTESTTSDYTYTIDADEDLGQIQFMSLSAQSITINNISLITKEEAEKPAGDVIGVQKDSYGYYSVAGLLDYYGMKFGTNVDDVNIYNSNNTNINNFHCNSITASNEMKAYSLLNQYACQNSADGMPRMNFTKADKIMEYATQNNLGVRGHTLVWDAYMNDWFFREDYDSSKAYVSQEVARARLKSYIEQVVTHFEEKYPGVIYCWDVVNEGVEPSNKLEANDVRCVENNIWSQRVGGDYIELSFKYAKDAVDKCAINNGGQTDIKLIYNDFATFYQEKRDAICNLVKSLNSYEKDSSGNYRKLCDGIGMQSYIGGYGTQNGCMNAGDISLIKNAILKFHALDVEVQVTEMAVRNYDNSAEAVAKHAAFCKDLFAMYAKLNNGSDKPLTGISIWGLYDNPSLPSSDYSWKMNGPYCGLYDENFKPKDAFGKVQEALVENLPESAFAPADSDKDDNNSGDNTGGNTGDNTGDNAGDQGGSGNVGDNNDQEQTASPISIKVNSDWGSGATAEITVTNTTGKDLEGWTCTFASNRPITQVWSGELTNSEENTYTVTNPSWQPHLAVGESYTFGCMMGSGDSNVTLTDATLK